MLGDFAGKLIADKYRVGELIREGESGDLYSGSSEIKERPVTLKILPTALAVDERWVKRFVREARSAALLSHPGILNISDFGTDSKGISYAVYEPTDGKTLDQLKTDEPIDEKLAIDIARQIAAALSAAHEKKTVHGSLNPQNIFATNEAAYKVYGFGGDPLNVSRNADPRYLAPEQCNPYPASDERSDVYSLGVILYELLAGAVPYEGTTAADILKKQNSEPPPPISAFRRDLHPEIEPIVLSAMAVDPERRYQTMAAFAEDLDILAGRLGSPVEKENAVAAAAGAAPKRNIWQTAIFVFAGVAIFAVALIYATSVRQTDPTETVQADVASLPVQPIGPATGAQEESLAKLPALTEAEIMATQNQMMSDLPGGDGFNAWANGGVPPAGAPLTGPLAGSMPGIPSGNPLAPPLGAVPPGGQMYTVGEGQSQFMPDFSPTGGVELRCRDVQTGADIPCPSNAPQPGAKPSPAPKTPVDTATPGKPGSETTPAKPEPSPEKQFVGPPAKPEKPAAQPTKPKPDPKQKKSGTQKDSEELPGGEQ